MLKTVDFERVGTASHGVGESPLWHTAHRAWYWVDILGKSIWRLDANNGDIQSWQTDEMIGCIAPRENGGFIAAMETGIFELVLDDRLHASTHLLASPAELAGKTNTGMRFNDGRCDRQGRFWSGTMVMDMAAARPEGKLYRYSSAQGISSPMVAQLLVQNGLAWSADGRTMYLSDSHPQSQLIWAFDYDTQAGTPTNQRVFVDMHQHEGRPDGAAIDVDGCYWTCGNDAGRLLRFTPQGKLDQVIALPMKKPAMCSFGGDNLDVLMVTSIGAGKAAQDAWAGATILLRPGVQGLLDTPFSD